MTYTNFSFPNDMNIFWSLMIVTYPYITGLIAGSFIASALYHVWGHSELKPISRFALLLSLSFGICASLPLLNHLGHPERALNIVLTPNFRSAIAGFGFIYSTYLLVLSLEIWLAYRVDIVQCYRRSNGWKRGFWGLLALGVDDISHEALKIDEKWIYYLSLIGIPAACLLHGYVGFLFGSLKSNPWWSTPLMPHVFLASAFQSGLAALIVLYLFLSWKGVLEKSFECLQSLGFFLWVSMVYYILSEGMEMLFFFYESSDAWMVISVLISEKLWFSFVILQVCIGVGIPFFLLTILIFFRKWESVYTVLLAVSAAICLVEVWLMRWNVVIGGQLFSKSYVGFREYHPQWFDKEGILVTIILTLLPILVLYVLSRFFTFRPAPAMIDDSLKTVALKEVVE